MRINILNKILKTTCYTGMIFFMSFRFALAVSRNKDRIIEKYRIYYMMMISWMDILEDKKCLSDYLEEKGYYRIAVYGAQDTGFHLVKQLQKTRIRVEYIIDRSGSSGKLNTLPVYPPDACLPEVDAIIVTPVWDYQNIKEALLVKNSWIIISLQDMIEGMRDV